MKTVRQENKILFIGLDSAGKSTIIMRLKDFKVTKLLIKKTRMKKYAKSILLPLLKPRKYFLKITL